MKKSYLNERERNVMYIKNTIIQATPLLLLRCVNKSKGVTMQSVKSSCTHFTFRVQVKTGEFCQGRTVFVWFAYVAGA